MKSNAIIDALIVLFPILLVTGLAIAVIFVVAAGDVMIFEELPNNDECVFVNWEENPLRGETVDRSGIYCLTDVEK